MCAITWAVLHDIRRSFRRAEASAIVLATAATLAACGRDTARPPAVSPGTPPPAAASQPSTSADAGVVDSGPVFLQGHAVIRPEAVGPLHVGAWRRAAMSWVYAITSFSGTGDMEITPVHRLGKDTVTVVIVNDTVSHLEVMRPGPRTIEGYGVGTPLAVLRAAPGASVAHDHGATVITLARYCGIQFSSADSSAHSGAPKKIAVVIPPDSAAVRTVIVGKCGVPRA